MLDQARLESETLKKIGLSLKTTRKSLGVSAIATAEAAGISRVTLHRVENGEPTVNVSAYVRVATVLDLDLAIQAKDQLCGQTSKSLDLPVRISLREYPALRQLAWHLPDAQSLSLLEAYRLFERNQRHLDHANLTDAERDLLHALQSAFQGEL